MSDDCYTITTTIPGLDLPYIIRKTVCNGSSCLTLWRRRERTFDAGARAYQTASGFWIVSRNHEACDVAATEKDARDMLADYARRRRPPFGV